MHAHWGRELDIPLFFFRTGEEFVRRRSQIFTRATDPKKRLSVNNALCRPAPFLRQPERRYNTLDFAGQNRVPKRVPLSFDFCYFLA